MKCANFFLTRNTVIHCAYGFIPACAQVGKLSPLYFNLWHFFRIGVGYREAMLNLLNLFSLKRSPFLSQFHILLFYVLLFHVLQFHSLHIGPSISRHGPAFSAPPLTHPWPNWYWVWFDPCCSDDRHRNILPHSHCHSDYLVVRAMRLTDSQRQPIAYTHSARAVRSMWSLLRPP